MFKREKLFDFYNCAGYGYENYWIGNAAYQISPELNAEIMQATYELTNMAYEAIDLVVNNPDLLDSFDIPDEL
jgi:glutathionylspermidine synthase